MSKDLTATIGVGVSLAGLILYSQHNLRAEILDLRKETRAEFKVVHEKFKAFRSEIQSLRTGTQAEFKTVRSEMQAEFRAVRSEMKAESDIHLEAIDLLRGDVG